MYVSEQDVHIFLGVLKIMCHIFCTLLRNSVSEGKKMDFDNVTFSGMVFFEPDTLKQIVPVVKQRVHVLSIRNRGNAECYCK